VADEQLIPLPAIEEEYGAAFSIRSESLPSLRDEWIDLHTAARAPGPFQRPEWHEAWLRNFGEGVQPVFLAVRHGEDLVGVAALAMGEGVAMELGDPHVRDYGGPLARAGFENDVVLALLDWVAEDMTPVLECSGVRANDPLLPFFRAEAADNGWDLLVETEANAPVASLPRTWDEFVASLSKHDRHELRRKLRNLEASGDLSYAATSDLGAIERDLGRLFQFMRASHEGKGRFLTPRMEAFFRDLAAAFAPPGLMRLGTLRLDGEPVAMLFTFEDADGVYLYNSGFDPAYGHLAVGLLSKALAIRDAIERGKTRFDFLRGDEDYKKRLGGVPQPVLKLTFRRR
jgi:CelD/BcsL family acetyltransferase involved in cellulose biosynthesis